MNEIYLNLILKWTGKRTGMEPETNFVIASIVGTEVLSVLVSVPVTTYV